MGGTNSHLNNFFWKSRSIAPLVTFRVLFGSLMCFSNIRFIQRGWIEEFYTKPQFFFKYYGFEWVSVPALNMLYFIFVLLVISALFIAIGFLYRASIISFFVLFTYVELLDATNYLNHYYLICLVAFLLIFLPANRFLSVDATWRPAIKTTRVSAVYIYVLMFQIAIVYFFAGIAKVNSDWLFRAMPLAIWLPEHQYLPIIGTLLSIKGTAFLGSWMGMFYDISVAFLLYFNRTRLFAYVMVIAFHSMTALLFNIGMFPWIMIAFTLIFFSDAFHEKIWSSIGAKFGSSKMQSSLSAFNKRMIIAVCAIYFCFQILLPLRHWVYPGNVLWTEEGYRFSWRVMLVEKNAQAIFTLKDRQTGRSTEIVNGHYLTYLQEKQMSIQPDFMLQFAHYLAKEYEHKHGMDKPIVTVDAKVALNGRRSRIFIDPTVDLNSLKDTFAAKTWILRM